MSGFNIFNNFISDVYGFFFFPRADRKILFLQLSRFAVSLRRLISLHPSEDYTSWGPCNI